MNKKGNIIDAFTVNNDLILLVIFIIIGGVLFTAFNTYIQSSTIADSYTKQQVGKYNTKYAQAYEYTILLLMIGLLIFSLVSARLIPSTKLFYIYSIFTTIFIWLFAIFNSYFYEKFAANAIISSYLSSLPIIDFLMIRLIYYAIIYTSTTAIALYTKEN